jgi:hypothetical protein
LSVHPEFLLCSEVFQILLKLGISQVSLIHPGLIINLHLHLACTLYLSEEAEVAVSMVVSRSFFTIALMSLMISPCSKDCKNNSSGNEGEVLFLQSLEQGPLACTIQHPGNKKTL